MKVLHLIAGAAHGGAETFSRDAVVALHELEGGGQLVLCREHEIFLRSFREAGIPFEIQTFARWKKWYEQAVIRRRIASYKPDLIHCWMTRTAEFMPKGTGVPCVGWSPAAIKLKYFKACDYYMGVNPEVCEAAKRESGHSDRVFLCHPFGTLRDDPPLSRKDFGIPEGMPVILMLARMHQEKGVDLLLCAALKLNAFLLLAGTGPELESYRELAKGLGIESRVCFAGWRNDRSALLDIADVLAVPSRRETFGAVMVEAWGRKVPVVASKTPGPRQYIEHGVNGLLHEIDSADDLAKNLEAVLKDNALRDRLVAGGTHTYESQFSKEVVVSNLLKTYEQIIRRGIPA